MSYNTITRALGRGDIAEVQTIVEATGLFPADMLQDMVEPFLANTAPHRWLVICENETVIGFAYSEPERMTDNAHNLLAIGVLPERQNRGTGKALVRALEAELAENGGRILIVETSSLDDFGGARQFYSGLGFAREAVIRDFYADGEDKIVFWKRI